MTAYHFSPEAVDDLYEIWSYIANDNVEAANRVEEAIYRACEFLAGSPSAGRIRKDLTSLPVRFWPVQPYVNYLVAYIPDSKPLQIIRILHGARNIPSMLK